MSDFAKRGKCVTIHRYSVTPTDSFNLFWQYTHERNRIETARRAGEPFPWTENYILRSRRFCSIFRVSDRACQFLITEVIEKGLQTIEEVVFRVVLFSAFTKCETWTLLEEELRPLTWASYKRTHYARFLKALQQRGVTLYTGAFQKHFQDHVNKVDQVEKHLIQLESVMHTIIDPLKDTEKGIEDLFALLRGTTGFGDFMAMQLLQNLSYSQFMCCNENEFIKAGPGAVSTFEKLFIVKEVGCKQKIKPNAETQEAIMRWMQATQWEHFARLGLDFTGLPCKESRRGMSLWDIEHTICEVGKYLAIAKGNGKKRIFPPPEGKASFPSTVTLPKAWNHPSRKLFDLRVEPSPHGLLESSSGLTELSSTEDDESDVETLPTLTLAPPSSSADGSSKHLTRGVSAVSDGKTAVPVSPLTHPKKRASKRSPPLLIITSAAQARIAQTSPVAVASTRTKRSRYREYNDGAGPSFVTAKRAKRERALAVVESDADEPQYLVECIVDQRYVAKRLQYLVKWDGYAEEENTWEPALNMWKDAPNQVRDFKEKKNMVVG